MAATVLASREADRWLPKSVLCLRDYNRHKFLLDLIAGITVGLVALPLAMAFCYRLGPHAASRHLLRHRHRIPHLLARRLQNANRRPHRRIRRRRRRHRRRHGIDGLFMCTVMAGVLLVIMGVTGLGTGVKFIPRPVVIGFTNGIAVLIASTQIKDFFGLHLEKVPGVFSLRMEALAAQFPHAVLPRHSACRIHAC